jgi:hypothetical protein
VATQVNEEEQAMKYIMLMSLGRCWVLKAAEAVSFC